MKFRVCFTLANYENDMLSISETTNAFIDAFLLFQNPFSSVRIRVCFTLANYENDMLSISETTNAFIDAFLLFQNPFSSVKII